MGFSRVRFISATVLVVCLVVESSVDPLAEARAQLIAHVNSGASPDSQFWSRFVAASKADPPKQEINEEIPKFKWHQTKSKLLLSIALPACRDESVEFLEDSVHVRGTSKGKKYGLKLELFKAIRKERSSFRVDGTGVHLTIKKKKSESYWPRLLKTKPVGSLKRALQVDWDNWVEENEDDSADEDDLELLDVSNFDLFMKQHKLVLVMFHAPWCGHCKSFAPEYAKAAAELDSVAKLAKVDAVQNKELATRFGVTGYPSLKLFRNGSFKKEYEPSDRTSSAVVSYMLRQAQPAVTVLPSADRAKGFVLENDSIGLVGYFKASSSSSRAQFALLAEELRDDYVFAEHVNQEPNESVMLFTGYREKPIPYEGELTRSAVEEWILLNALPVLPNLSDQAILIPKYKARALPFVYVLVENGRDPAVKHAEELSIALSGEYSVVMLNLSDKARLSDLGVTRSKIADPKAHKPDEWDEEEDGAWNAPEIEDTAPIVAVDSADRERYYVLDQKLVKDRGVTLELLQTFVEQHRECKQRISSCALEPMGKARFGDF